MEEKKAKHVNLEKKRGLFIQVGFLITLTIILTAFEWSVEKHETIIPKLGGDSGPETYVINTYQEEEKLERPKPNLSTTDIIQLIDNGIELDDEDLLFDIDEQFSKNDFDYTLDPEEYDDLHIFVVVEDMPIFRPLINKTVNKANLDLHRYVASRIKYPEMASLNGIQGKIYVKFVVNKSGKVTDVRVARDTDPLLDAEAIRVVKLLPDFKPGMQRGKAVNVSYHVTINFKLG